MVALSCMILTSLSNNFPNKLFSCVGENFAPTRQRQLYMKTRLIRVLHSVIAVELNFIHLIINSKRVCF